jgi:hypothetical protein
MKTGLSLSLRSPLARSLLMAAIGAGGFVIGGAIAAQPHMQGALSALMTARAELQVAEHNKGGHRAVALERVNEAIRQVQMGIEAGGG